jgi:hypothetical protein
MSDNITISSLDRFDEVEKDILGALAPQMQGEEVKLPEKNVTRIKDVIERSRGYTSKKLNKMLNENILEVREKNNSRLYRISDLENLQSMAILLRKKREDIQSLEKTELEDIESYSIIDPKSTFGTRQFRIYSSNSDFPAREDMMHQPIEKESWEALRSEETVRLRHLINALARTLVDYYQDSWREELSSRYDVVLEEKASEDEKQYGKEIKEAIIDIIWNNQAFKAEFEDSEHYIEFPAVGSEEFENTWERVTGLLEPEDYKKLEKIDNARELIAEVASEAREVREFTILISERLDQA